MLHKVTPIKNYVNYVNYGNYVTELQIIDFTTGFSGNIHHSRVLRHTALSQRANNNGILLEPKANVNGHQIGPMLLGNGVNLLSKWILNQYIFRPTLTAQERNLNKNSSSARATVERAFEILKVVWRSLLITLVANRENVSNTIMT